jgi:hypothetical protein
MIPPGFDGSTASFAVEPSHKYFWIPRKWGLGKRDVKNETVEIMGTFGSIA